MQREQALVWEQPKSIPALAEGEVQVWRVATGAMDTRLAAGRALLNAEELARMERIRAGLPRDEFVLGRGCLRALLGRALGQLPCDIGLETGPHGKPRLAGSAQDGQLNLEFNVAHSKGTILIALCRGAAVGVDLEWIDLRIEALEIAEKNFAPAERAVLESASKTSRALEFFRIWAKKEAVVKAHSQGLTLGLTGFDTSRSARTPVRLALGEESETYSVTELPVGAEFAAALAVLGDAIRLKTFHLNGELLEDLLQNE